MPANARLITIADGNRNDAAIWRIANNNTTSILHATTNYAVTTATTRYSDYFTPNNAADQSVGVLIMPIDGLTLSQTVTVELMEGTNVRASKTINPSADGLKRYKWFFVAWTVPYVYGNTTGSTWRIRISGTDAGGTFLLRAGATTSTYGVRVVNSNPSAVCPTSANGDYEIIVCHTVQETADSNLDFGDTGTATTKVCMIVDSGAYILKGSVLTASRSVTLRGEIYQSGFVPQISWGMRCMVQYRRYWMWVASTVNAGQNTLTLLSQMYDGWVRKLSPDYYTPQAGDQIFVRGDNEYEHEYMTVQSYNPATLEITFTTNFVYTHTVSPITVDSFAMTHTRNATSGTNHDGYRSPNIIIADKSNLGIGYVLGNRLERHGNPWRCTDQSNWRNHYCLLASDANAGQAQVVLAKDMNVKAGDVLTLTTTQSGTGTWEQEIITVQSYNPSTKTVTLNGNLTYTHLQQPAGSPPRQTMAIFHSRNFTVNGADTNNRAWQTACGGAAVWADGPYAGNWLMIASNDSCVEFKSLIGSGTTNSTSAWVVSLGNVGLFEGCSFDHSGRLWHNGDANASIMGFINCTSPSSKVFWTWSAGAPFTCGFYDNCCAQTFTAPWASHIMRSCKAYGFNVAGTSQSGIIVGYDYCELYDCDAWGNKGFSTYSNNFAVAGKGTWVEGCRAGFYNQQMALVRSFGLSSTLSNYQTEASFIDCYAYDPTLIGNLFGPLTVYKFQRLNGSNQNQVFSSNDQMQSLYAWSSELCGVGYSDTQTIAGKNARKIRFNFAYGEDRTWQIAAVAGESFGLTFRVLRTASMSGGRLYGKLIGAGLNGDVDSVTRVLIPDVLTEQSVSLIAVPPKNGTVTLSLEWRGNSIANSYHDLYVGDLQIRQRGLRTGDLTIWDRGLPVPLLVNSETTAKDIWDFTRDLIATDANSMGQIFLRALGLLGENVIWDNPVYNSDGNVTSIRMRIYDTKANALAAGATGQIAEYTITDTYASLLRQTQTMVRE